MNHPNLPMTVIHDIINKYLTCQDQLIASYVFNKYFWINDQSFATVLRASKPIDLSELFRSIIKKNNIYIQREGRVCIRNTTISWPCFLPKSFDFNTMNKIWAYYRTGLFSLYVRLFSYSPFVYRPKFTLVDVFKVPFVFEHDYLSHHEQSFFQVYNEDTPTPPEIVKTFQEFENNLNYRFGFDKIYPFINFDQFVLAGGAVLISMLRNPPVPITCDLDFFYIGHNFHDFIDLISNIQNNLNNIYLINQFTIRHRRVYQFDLLLGTTVADLLNDRQKSKKIILQFIYHEAVSSIESYLSCFDFDIVQIAYTGNRVVSTWAFIRAINTGTFICYNLRNNMSKITRNAIRIAKYYQRNFKFLYPHAFEMSNFLSLRLNQRRNLQPDYYFSTNEQFGENNDYFELQMKFINTYINRWF